VSLLRISHALLVRIGRFRGAIASRRHVKLLWRSIDYYEVVLTCVIVHVLLNIIVGLLNVVELLLLEIIVVYRGMIIVVILNLDVLSCLGALGLLLYR
jgi:hypothetical protein